MGTITIVASTIAIATIIMVPESVTGSVHTIFTILFTVSALRAVVMLDPVNVKSPLNLAKLPIKPVCVGCGDVPMDEG